MERNNIRRKNMFYSTTWQSPVSLLTLACDGDNLAGLWMAGQKYFGGTIPGEMIERADIPVFDAAKKWLDSYFAGEKPAITDLPLMPVGSDFRQDIWKILCEIPYGQVITYADIAKKVAAKRSQQSMSSQAVGGAVGHNPISIIIPCHRVVGSDGSLTGFAGGIDIKVKLLKHEGVDMSGLFIPRKGTAL